MPAWLAPMLASMAAGAGSSAINNMMGDGGEMGYDMPMMTPSPYDAQNQQMMAQIAQQNAINYQAGRLPPGIQILLDQIQKRQLQTSQEQMYGRPGQRGGSIMDNTMSMASKGGVGPKAMMAQGSKAMGDYAQRNSQIMNYIDSLKYSGMQKQGSDAFNQMKSMPRSSEIPYQGQVVQMNTPGQAGGIDLSGLDWNEMFNPKKGITINTSPQTQVGAQSQYSGYEFPAYQHLSTPDNLG